MTKKIAAYFRRSTKDSGQENSIERQRKALDNFLKSHSEDYELADEYIFVEDGRSGDDSVNRPVFNSLMDLVKSGECPFQAIFVSSPDRWGRFNPLRCETYVWPLVENEIVLATSDKIYHWEESGAGLYYLIFSSFSHQNNEDKSSKVINGLARKVEDCSFQLAPPYGMKKKSNAVGLVPDKNSWIVKRIFDYFQQYKSTCRVTRIINRDGIVSPKGTSWSHQAVKRVLQNGKYAGFYEFGRKQKGKFYSLNAEGKPEKRKPKVRGKVLDSQEYKKEYRPDLIEPIVTKQTFGKVQLMLAGRYKSWGKAKGKYRYSGLLICAHCNKKMRTRKRGDGIRVYCCGSGRVRGCHGNHIKESIIDEQTYSTLQKYFMNPDSKELLMMELGMIRETKEKTNKELQALKARYKNAQERLNNFNSHLPKGFSEALEALSKEIEAKKEELEYKTTDIEIEEEADLMIRSIGDGIAKLDRDTILGIDWLQKYVESITIEFKHTRRGRKEFSTPIVAKYNLLQPKVHSVLRTYPITTIFPDIPLRMPNQEITSKSSRRYCSVPPKPIRQCK